MHIVGYYQQRKPRRHLEERVARINSLIIAGHLACFIYGIIQISSATADTVSSSFGSDKLVPSEFATNIMALCNATVRVHRGSFSYDVVMDPQYGAALLARLLNATTLALVFNGLVLLISFINKVAIEFGRHSWQLRSITFYQSTLQMLEMFLTLWALAVTAGTEPDARIMRDYFRACGSKRDLGLQFTSPFVALFVALGLSLFWQVACGAVYLYIAHKKCHLDARGTQVDEFGDVLKTRPKAVFNNKSSGRLRNTAAAAPLPREDAYAAPNSRRGPYQQPGGAGAEGMQQQSRWRGAGMPNRRPVQWKDRGHDDVRGPLGGPSLPGRLSTFPDRRYPDHATTFADKPMNADDDFYYRGPQRGM